MLTQEEAKTMGSFSERLKALRNQRGLSQEALADSLGITRSRLGNYEQGIREADFETLELLADYFNVSVDYLLGKTEVTPMLLNEEQKEVVDLVTAKPILKDMLLAGGRILESDPRYIEALVYTMQAMISKK